MACRLGGKDGDGAALRSQNPRRNRKQGEEERSEDVETVSPILADRHTGCCCAGQIEDDAGVGPFLEARKARGQDGDGS